MTQHAKTFSLTLMALAVFSLLLCAVPPLRAQLSTDDHLADPGFWPTQHARSRGEYAGEAACAQCHRGIAVTQFKTSMRLTTIRVLDSQVLATHPKLTFQSGAIHYQIDTKGSESTYTVTDGARTLTAQLLWAFGTGRVGQSYLFKKEDGNFYEARVTYFPTLGTLNFTPARAVPSPKNLEEAMYRLVPPLEVDRCFACHTTLSTVGEKFDENGLIPGVTCEACHGPGEKHVETMQAAKLAGISPPAKYIFNPARLNPADSVDFCGACHNTWWDIVLSGMKGVANVRSNPYRLQGSKCWGNGDPRITCIACHDPHVEVVKDSASYDHNCLNCHLASPAAKPDANHPGKACPVGTKECSSCHMPKVYDPQMHYSFTDHKIRIAHPGEPYTD